MFKAVVREKMKTCNSLEDYRQIKKLLKEYGIEKFRQEMEELKVFKKGETQINAENNPFAQMLFGKYSEQFEKINEDFIIIDSDENLTHKFLVPKILDWDCFNVLTLSNKHLALLREMKTLAFLYAFENRIRKFGLYFHCYPFNSVNILHLHIVDLNAEPEFLNKTNNLKLDDVISYLEQSIETQYL